MQAGRKGGSQADCRQRQTDRERDRQTDRHSDRQAARQAVDRDRQTGRERAPEFISRRNVN